MRSAGDERQDRRVDGRRPVVAVTDLGDEPQGQRIDLDRATGVPGGEQPVAPRQRRGVGRVGEPERRPGPEHGGLEQLGAGGPQPLRRRVDHRRAPRERARRRTVRPWLQRQAEHRAVPEERVQRRGPLVGCGDDDLAGEVVGPAVTLDVQVQVGEALPSQDRSRDGHGTCSSRQSARPADEHCLVDAGHEPVAIVVVRARARARVRRSGRVSGQRDRRGRCRSRSRRAAPGWRRRRGSPSAACRRRRGWRSTW